MKVGALTVLGGTIIDGTGRPPIRDGKMSIESGRIIAVGGPKTESARTGTASKVDATGKYIVPGLMDANVHLLGDIRLESYARYEGRYEGLIAEAAQIALKNGLTTVFDTWGPRKPLIAVRAGINAQQLPGSRIFFAGNIIGLDGPFSLDFLPKTLGSVSTGLMERTNALYAENVGPDLTWMTPDQVAQEVRSYLGRGVDFIKYAASEHRWQEHEGTASLLFSPRVQRAIVEEAHRAGTTAQAHTTAVEALHVALEAGCDIVQHANITGPVPIPDATLDLIAQRKAGTVVFPLTERRKALLENTPNPQTRRFFSTAELNCRNLISCGATLLLGTDAVVSSADALTDPKRKTSWMRPGEDNLSELGEGHFVWLQAMEEKGLPAMEGLRAATRNIATAYGKSRDLGTLEAGKIADLLILDKDPLQSAANYRSIHMIIKDGMIVDREALPAHRVLTKPAPLPDETTAAYGRFAMSKYPCCG